MNVPASWETFVPSDELVASVVLKFMTEMTDKHPGVTVEVMGKQPWSSADSWLRVIYPSAEASLDISDTHAHLGTKYLMDEGVSITCMGQLSEEAYLFEEDAC